MFAIQEELLYAECGARLNNFYLSKLLCIFPSLFAKNLNKARYNIYANLLPVFSTEVSKLVSKVEVRTVRTVEESEAGQVNTNLKQCKKMLR